MAQSEWLYTPSREIKNLKDLELEKQRLNLHQKFLGELLKGDKQKLKDSLSLQNILSTAVFSFTNNNTNSGEGGVLENLAKNSPYGKLFGIVKWIIKTFFKK